MVPSAALSSAAVSELIHTCYRIGDIDRSVGFYEALGFERASELDWQPTEALRLLGLRIEVAFAG